MTFFSYIAFRLISFEKGISNRQVEGIAAAQKEGKRFGRPKQAVTEAFRPSYDEWKVGDITAVEAMKRSGMGKDTFYRRVKEYESTVTSTQSKRHIYMGTTSDIVVPTLNIWTSKNRKGFNRRLFIVFI
ncbi:hypothetical protein JCM10914A_28570 [Paenibacillus sp. JCM 10914]